MHMRRALSAGLGLIELMVAVALGAALCLGVASLLLAVMRQYWHDEQLAMMRDNGRYAIQLLEREFSMVGFYGHVWPADVKRVIDSDDGCYSYLLGPMPMLEHFDDLDSHGVSPGGESIPEVCRRENYYQPGSDAVLLRRALDHPLRLRGENLGTVTDGETYLQSGNHEPRLSRGGGVSRDLWRFVPSLWFVRHYSVRSGDDLPGLCRMRLSRTAALTAPIECLVEGVEQLQITYALDANGDRRADMWGSTPDVDQLKHTLLVSIRLGMRSPLPLSLSGDFLRTEMTSVVLLRNSDAWRG
ncbi:hypothetical protein A3709_11535 [Halioglobus sp. HI00S01]|nr:hypothetical protein A3709_11535 [Halioglobus sp. HI00S01]